MEEIENIRAERKEVGYKMIDVSEYINSSEFQHAKGDDALRADNIKDEKVDIASEALNSISTKVAAKIKELEAEFEKIERMYKIMDIHSCDMWKYYLAEEGK